MSGVLDQLVKASAGGWVDVSELVEQGIAYYDISRALSQENLSFSYELEFKRLPQRGGYRAFKLVKLEFDSLVSLAIARKKSGLLAAPESFPIVGSV